MSRNANPYLAIGVRPFINCCSVRTVQGGSLMLPVVREAMAEASKHFVNLDELMEAAGARLAELTGAEWGIVTCGSAAAVALGTAACVAGNDPVKMLRLPFTEGMPNRVIMPRNQRFAYDQAIRMIGTHIIEIDDRAGLDAALAEPVAMVALLGTHEHQSKIRLEEIASVVTPRGIPIMVDAASEHLERPSPWLARGADLVVYSGGKFLRGPQTSGLLLGRKDLVLAAWRNASPHQAIGRPMKVSKEDVIGLLAAVEYWFNDRDRAAEQRRWSADNEIIAAQLAGLATAEILEPTGVERVPRLRISWDVGMTGDELRQRLLDGSPRIVLDDMSAGPNSIAIEPFGLQTGEAEAVGRAIAAALSAGVQTTAAPVPPRDVAGDWDLRVQFLHGERVHRLHIGQTGPDLTGKHSSPGFEGPVTGRLTQDGVAFRFDLAYEGTQIAYRFDGKLANGSMGGTVALGTSNDHHQGLVNLAQFGSGKWQASRR